MTFNQQNSDGGRHFQDHGQLQEESENRARSSDGLGLHDRKIRHLVSGKLRRLRQGLREGTRGQCHPLQANILGNTELPLWVSMWK